MSKKVIQQPKKDSPFKTAILNLPFHNFEKEKTLIGIYNDTVTLGDAEKLDKDGKPATFAANIFTNLLTGEQYYVQNSYSIHKAIKLAKEEYHDDLKNIVFNIEFMKKTMLKGKPFNEFTIGYCTLAEYESFSDK
jgi:hypothetical protein